MFLVNGKLIFGEKIRLFETVLKNALHKKKPSSEI
jgi:hypothetical protein